jgi:hypothetical protein
MAFHNDRFGRHDYTRDSKRGAINSWGFPVVISAEPAPVLNDAPVCSKGNKNPRSKSAASPRSRGSSLKTLHAESLLDPD